jgi:hypothetical protein
VASLTRHGADVHSVLSLLGQDENDLTAALGFTLARCRPLSTAVLRRVWPAVADDEDVSFALEVRAEVGRTDLEVRLPAVSALLIFEAKRDWLLPTSKQLTQYVSRIRRYGAGVLVSLSQASQALAATQLPKEIRGVPVHAAIIPCSRSRSAQSIRVGVIPAGQPRQPGCR